MSSLRRRFLEGSGVQERRLWVEVAAAAPAGMGRELSWNPQAATVPQLLS